MGKIAQGVQACQRISKFLELEIHPSENNQLTGFDHRHEIRDNEKNSVFLSIINGNFTVGGSQIVDHKDLKDLSKTITKNSFTLSGINLEVKQSKTLAVIGPVGSGKSMLLKVFLGDIQPNEISHSKCNIKVHGKVAYASQNPFILNTSMRNNILFGNEYKKDLYERVLEDCNLMQDIKQFSAGDLTEIGERGITLSGGQKARISLARCIYSQPSVALFDDILSALDAHTGKWVFERVFKNTENKNNLLANAAVVLVTHASHFLSQIDNIVLLCDGKQQFVGKWEQLKDFSSSNPKVQKTITSICSSKQEVSESRVNNEKLSKIKNNVKGCGTGSLMTEEEREFGFSNLRTWGKW